ncbi:thrombopoietin receptor isoform X2 [Carassius carassius]|uniref:thrombopoietin receptor isoform X2 n=1 Tax=Carassius carassius TaxID=217509 RepID=UPI002868D0B0|nr:thrombopoietin receptor isoform X2 [Carassius carassius]
MYECPVYMMDSALTWWILLSCLIKQVHLEPYLSKQDFALLAMDKDPKCFTRDLEAFTCFWEAPAGKSYNFFYKISSEEKTCDVKQQTYEEKKVLHICTFPSRDVFMYVEMYLRVTDRDTNTTIFSRTVSVEDQLFLYRPTNVSLHPTGEVGQMLVEWKKNNKFPMNMQYEIRYRSKNTSSTVTPVSKHSHKLVSLVAGENCTVQMRVKPGGVFWSDWSSPVTAMVPQTAGDIKLRCHTPDLHQVLCQWRGDIYDDGRYSFHYRQLNRSLWDSWKLCSRDNDTVHQCVLYGQGSSIYQFYLSVGLQPFGRTFYAETFSMNSSIQTRPPEGLKAQPEEGRLCLTWDPPFFKISQYLKYQIRYQREGESEWKDFTTPSSKTSTCLDVHRGSQYTIQVRAQPNGSVYSGDWKWIFIVCIPVALLIIASAMISFFSRYFRKFKKSLWPSVPNLNNVLESFLTDISGSHWEPTFNIKQCVDDSATSVLEILPEKQTSVKSCKKSTSLSLPDRGFLADVKNKENFREDSEMTQDYVTLNNDVIPCFTWNDYVYRDAALSHLANEKHSCPNSANIFNHSYLLLSEQSDLEGYHSACHQYTNLEITAIVYEANGE